MSAPLRVSSKVKLAEALGISRPTLYAFMRLPDSPPPRNCYWYVKDFREFITRKRGSVNASDKEQLQIALLDARLQRERYEFDEARETTYKKVREDLLRQFTAVLHLIKSRWYRLRNELSPKFASLDNPRAIFQLWEQSEAKVMNELANELERRTGAKLPEKDTLPAAVNVVNFGQPNGNGAKVSPTIPNRRVATG